jgi:hypothetical protein
LTILNEDNLIDQQSEQLPNCSGLAEFYLKALVSHARASSAPVTLDVQGVPLTSGPQPAVENRLVLTPQEGRLRHFQSLHYARPIGSALLVGYDLTGARRARGLGGFVDLGGANQGVMDGLRHLMDFIEQSVILPAIQDTTGAGGTTVSRVAAPPQNARQPTVRYIIDS